MSVTSGYDFSGNNAVYVEGFARDSYCANSIRSLTDREVVKHVGDVDGFGPWWESILEQVQLVTDDLLGFITDAQEITVDFTDVPFNLEEFYTLLAFPEYLAEHAAGDARSNAADPFKIDMWILHSGATYALTHFFRGKEGDALDSYVWTANGLLFNPEGTLEELMREFVEATDATESMASVQHAMKALNGLHHARPAILAAGGPDYLEDRDRELIEERPEGIHAIVDGINGLEDMEGEDIDEARESLQHHLHQVMYRGYVPDHPPQLDDA